MAHKVGAGGGDLLGRIHFARAMEKAGPHGGLTPWDTKFVLYRPSHRKEKKDKIVLVSDRRKK